MKWSWPAMLIVVLLPGVLPAQIDLQNASQPVLRVQLAPHTAYVQQQIVQTVSLTSIHPFESIDLQLLAVAGAKTVELVAPRNRPHATYGFEGYLFETVRAIFPAKSGQLEIAAVRITGSLRLPDGSLLAFDRRAESQFFEIAPRPADYDDDHWIVARGLTMQQHYSSPLEELRIGDIVQRTVMLEAIGVEAAQLPEPVLRQTRSMTVLAGPVVRNTSRSATGLNATLKQTFDIRIDGAGVIDFAPITLPWWSAEHDTRMRASVPAARVEPLPRDPQALVAQLMAEARTQRDTARVWLHVLGIATALALVAFGIHRLFRARRHRVADRQLKCAMVNELSALPQLAAVHDWLRCCFAIVRPTRTAIRTLFYPELALELEQLQARAFGGEPAALDGRRLAARLIDARKRYRAPTREQPANAFAQVLLGKSVALPELEGDSGVS